MNWHDYIGADASVLTGKPVIRGTRLSVEFILNLLAEGWSEEEVLRNYPGLTQEHTRACLAYARDLLSEERVFFPSLANEKTRCACALTKTCLETASPCCGVEGTMSCGFINPILGSETIRF